MPYRVVAPPRWMAGAGAECERGYLDGGAVVAMYYALGGEVLAIGGAVAADVLFHAAYDAVSNGLTVEQAFGQLCKDARER